MRKYGKIDKNQTAIVEFARQCGATVYSLASLGGGVPDLLVGHQGHTQLWEIKTKKGKLTPDQIEFNATWNGEYVHIVRTIEDAAQLLGVTL